jgi:hypothetical protein
MCVFCQPSLVDLRRRVWFLGVLYQEGEEKTKQEKRREGKVTAIAATEKRKL